MNKLFTLSILSITLFITGVTNAQLTTISQTHQLPIAGDSIHYVDANSFGFNGAGVGPVTAKVWDLSSLMLTGTTMDFVYVDPTTIPTNLGKDSFPTATIARSESNSPGYFYYENTANNINRLGWYSSSTNYGIYTNGTIATEFHFPITAGNNFSSTYHGVYSPFNVGEDSVRITDGTLSMSADMQGQMILPTGTFNGILRLHVLESFHIKTYMFGIAVIDNIISDDYYYWFSDSILQPLLISGLTTVDGTAQTPVLRYQPISSPTGIAQNNSQKEVTIFPNPSTGKFTIKNTLSSLTNTKLEIYNTLGEKIDFTTTKNEIDLTHSPKGIYLLKISEERNVHFEKLIIE